MGKQNLTPANSYYQKMDFILQAFISYGQRLLDFESQLSII